MLTGHHIEHCAAQDLCKVKMGVLHQCRYKTKQTSTSGNQTVRSNHQPVILTTQLLYSQLVT